MLSASFHLPRWLVDGIKPNEKGARIDKFVYGGDTETLNGEPLSFQFYSEDGKGCNDIIFTNAKSALRDFLKWCRGRQRDCLHVVYVHNLDFDLIEFLWGQHAKLITPGGDFEFNAHGWTLKGVYGAPTFCRISDGHHRSILLVNSFSYFRGSLEKAAELFCPDLPKLRKIDGLGARRFTSRDTDFVAYAMRDAEIAYHIGRSLEELHSEFNIKQTVSVADMAATIFRHNFLTYTIPQPPRDVIDAALLSYHGGKNNVAASPGWHEGVSSLDISSAYPHAMSELPAFSNAKLYKRVKYKRGSKFRNVPDYGVYCVTGTVAPCEWPVVFDHAFKPIRGGEIEKIWLQGFELNEAIRSGELKISRLNGYVYDHERDKQAPALRAFVTDFYRRKETETNKVRKFMWKLIQNSISGKFIQTRKISKCTFIDVDGETITNAAELIAGGMCHPFIASTITAHTRARMHRVEHKYKALHTATDGIFTQASPKSERKKLGALTTDASGELLLVRNKLYILYSKDGETKSEVFRGKRIAKYALHGFQGKVGDLERLLVSGKRSYKVNKPNRLRDSLKRGLVPNLFVERRFNLRVGDIPMRKPK